MPRTARLIVPNYPFHITHRGNNKEIIFQTDEDRRRYLYLFEEAKQKYGMHVIAYCLMNNHVHYVAFPENEASFAKTINTVHTRYAQYFNQKYNRVGHLWQGRYYSCLLDESHLLAAVRYVERNPVRSGLTIKPWEWIWSSATEHVGLERRGIVSLKEPSSYMSIPSWQAYIDTEDRSEDISEIRKQTFSLRAWADRSFIEEMESKYGIKLTIGSKGRPKKMGTSTIYSSF
jgi:putative transposase